MNRTISQAQFIANTTNDWRKALDVHKHERKGKHTMDWLGLEATLRAYIKAVNDPNLDEIVAEFTLRGYELPYN